MERISIVAVVLAAGLICGCGKEDEAIEVQPVSEEPKPAQAEQPAQAQSEPAATPTKPEEAGYFGTLASGGGNVKAQAWLLAADRTIQSFKALYGRNPKSIQELEEDNLPLPKLPKGLAFDYDPASGKVTLKTTRK